MSSQFQPYLESIRATYVKWWERYTFTDATGKQRQTQEESPFFDFGLMVQTVKREERDRQTEEKVERFSVLDGLRKYADQQVLLVGRPGSGKSTALARLMLEEVTDQQTRIPVLVELRYWQGSIEQLIRDSFNRHGLAVEQLEEVLLRSLILFDGVNELPSEEARSQLSAFRRNHPKVPMIFTTRDLSLGGDLGIEKKLEMQPLTEEQMREFVRSYLSAEQAEKMLRQLNDRLREFGKTPLLLWMLCEVIQQSPDSTLPRNLGEIFKVFTEAYEQSSVRRHEVAALKGDVKPLSDRRVWKKALKALAWLMMQGEMPVDFRVVIDRDEAERELSRIFPNERFPVRDVLDDLLNYHLLQNASTDQIEFRHQLIQEYYAAEALSKQLPELSNEVLKQEYLDYLKWTEPVALMLALVKDEEQALRVVEQAAHRVNLILGARLAGQVKPKFQSRTVALIIDADDITVPYKISLLGITRSDEAIGHLEEILRSKDYSKQRHQSIAVDSLGKIGSTKSIDCLMQVLEGADQGLRFAISSVLRELSDDVSVSSISIEDFYSPSRLLQIRQQQNQISIEQLFDDLHHGNAETRFRAALLIGRREDSIAISELIQALQDNDWQVRQSVINALGRVGDIHCLDYLLPLLETEDINRNLVESLTAAISAIQQRCKYYNYEIYQAHLEAQRADRQTPQNNDRSPTINQFPNATQVKIFENVDRYYEAPSKDQPS